MAPAAGPRWSAAPGRTIRSAGSPASTTQAAAARWETMRTAGETRRTSSVNDTTAMTRAPASTQPYPGAGAARNAADPASTAVASPAATPANIATPPARDTGRSCSERSLGRSTSRRLGPHDTSQPAAPAPTASATTAASRIMGRAASGTDGSGRDAAARMAHGGAGYHMKRVKRGLDAARAARRIGTSCARTW